MGVKYHKPVLLYSRQIAFTLCAVFVILGGLRWVTGTDWISYSSFFLENQSWKSFAARLLEPGYTFLNFLVKQFTNSYTVFLFIFHFLVIVPKIYFIKHTAYYPLLSILLYWCIYNREITAVRNALAVSFLLLSVFAIQNKQKGIFVFLTLLATSIHYSCAVWFRIQRSSLFKKRTV